MHTRFGTIGKRAVRSRARDLMFVAAVGALLLPLTTRALEAQGIRYSLVPSAEYVFWDNDLGLDDDFLYGGALSFVFGNYVSLRGFYLTNNGVDTKLGSSGLTAPGGGALVNQRVDLDAYGADVLVNVGAGQWHPFVRAGGGVLRFDPDQGAVSRQILLRAGAGLRFGEPGNVQFQLGVDDWMFRVNRFRFAELPSGTPLPDDPESDDLRHNWAVTGGVQVPIGGSGYIDDAPQLSLGQFGVPIEIMTGRLDFNDDFDADNQYLIGARAGVNFGSMVGLRGYYWKGVTDDYDDTQGISSWGGEAQFNLGGVTGISPFLLAGAGQLRFNDDYRDGALGTDNRTVLILGGGLSLNLTETLKLNASARDYLWSDATDQLQDVDNADELKSNWLFSAGLSFNIGGNRNMQRPAPRRVVQVDTVQTAQVDTVYRYVDRATGDTLTGADAVRARDRAAADARRRQAMTRMRDTVQESAGAVADEHDFTTNRILQVPVPREGEIYLRYGPGEASMDSTGTVQRRPPVTPMYGPRSDRSMSDARSSAELREAVREVLRDELERERMARERFAYQRELAREMMPDEDRAGAQPPAPAARQRPLTRQELERFERELMSRLDRQLPADRRGDMTQDSLRAMVRDMVEEYARPREGPATQPAEQPLSREEMRSLIRESVRDEIDRLRPMQATQPAQPAQGGTRDTVIYVPADTTLLVSVRRQDQGPVGMEPRWSAETASGYTGFGFGDATQGLLGARVSMRTPWRSLPNLFVVPELAFGFGDGTTTSLFAANAQYRLGRMDGGDELGRINPYVGLGVGFLNFSDAIGGHDSGLDLVLNPSVGVIAGVPTLGNILGSGASQLFVEYQGVDMFDLSRFLVGLQWSMR